MAKFNNYFEAYTVARGYNNILMPWEKEIIPVFDTKTGIWITATYIGNYGTFDCPIVEVDGDEIVLNAGWLDPATEKIAQKRISFSAFTKKQKSRLLQEVDIMSYACNVQDLINRQIKQIALILNSSIGVGTFGQSLMMF